MPIPALIQELKERHPELVFEMREGSIVCIVNNFSYGVLHSDGTINEGAIHSLKRMRTFLNKEVELIKMGKSGKYAIVLPNLTIGISQTEGAALNFAARYSDRASVYRIGKNEV